MASDDGELPIFSSSNDDIFVEILSWLPVISLLRFRCVCKSWRDLISTYQFVAKHRAHTNDNNKNKNVGGASTSAAASSAILSSRRDLEDEFAFDTSVYSSSLVGSSNGLICCARIAPKLLVSEHWLLLGTV
ncbi:hypothetical protein DVH24_033184 [Malus domestica]|uniref:F-box domain-containing protein n=1 Tax=Malus domestica TaxID=3750 RepID=A0A498J9B5_MALDO|nr:hypothetical protein DVH24_033184 [Malus domestica]